MKVSRVDEMRVLDRTAVEEFGITEELLMENAGHAVYFTILRDLGIKGKSFVVFCGIGNNGGDGLVVARKIHSNGGDVKVFILGDPERYKGAAKINYEIVRALSIQAASIESVENARLVISHCDAVVDAVFGTGLTRNVEGLFGEVIDLINESGKRVYSVDIPSGVNGDTGAIMGPAVRADHTITFGLPKIGNILYPGYELGGELSVTYISFPPALYEANTLKVEINLPPVIPPRDPAGHKGDFGEALFVAGASTYYGAPYFAALSFMKAGGGYARLAAPGSITPFLANKGSEIVFMPQKETPSQSISGDNKDALVELSDRMDVVVLGPGVSLDRETQQLVRDLAKGISKPLILDGDGITAVSEDLDVIRERKGETVITPHPGEMSRITGKSISEIGADRIGCVQETAIDLHSAVVLKGAHSLIGFPDQRIFINMSGNSGMATAGSGDVLTGTIAAMFGLGMSFQDSVRKGVFIHGLSGDLAAEEKGEDGITAQDIMDYLPVAVKMDRTGIKEPLRMRYEGPNVI